MSSSAAAIPVVGGQSDDGIYLLISREDLDHAGTYRCPSRRPPSTTHEGTERLSTRYSLAVVGGDAAAAHGGAAVSVRRGR